MKIRKKLWGSVAVLCLFFTMAGCEVLPKLDLPIERQKTRTVEKEFTTDQESLLYGYQNLSLEEQVVYRQLVHGIETFQEKITLSPVSEERLEVIFNRVMIDHPEYFWTEGGFQYYAEAAFDGSMRAMMVLPEYLMGKEEAEPIRAQIEGKAQEWISKIPAEADTYEKVKYIYEQMIREIPYEDQSANNQNIQSVFLGGSTVCMGYSKAMQYLLNKMGIFCTLVTGTVTDERNEGHAWNLVRIGEQYYYVDVTWGNPGYSESQNSGVDIYYSYLCCPDQMLEPTHQANEDIPLPECRDDRYNYYRQKGCWYETYDEKQIYEKLREEINSTRHSTELSFSTREACEMATEELLHGELIQKAVQNCGNLSPGQEISWQIYYGGWDNLIVITWN